MAFIEITEEKILNANTYINGIVKQAAADVAASCCCNIFGVDKDSIFPPVWKENRVLRQQFIYGILAFYYLGEPFECVGLDFDNKEDSADYPETVNFCMTLDSYNEWASSHVINQLERLKKSKNHEVSNKVYDLLYDFKCFENIVLGTIRDNLERLNDPLMRTINTLETVLTPEYVKELSAKLDTASAELAEYKAKREAQND